MVCKIAEWYFANILMRNIARKTAPLVRMHIILKKAEGKTESPVTA